MKEIFRNNSAFGGYGYRVMSDGLTAKIERRQNGGKWKAVRAVSLSTFEAFAQSAELYNVYDQNPAKLSHFAEAI